MKKLLSILLAGVTACSLAVTAFASPMPTNETLKAGIYFGPDKDTKIKLQGALLTPGKDYKFPVLVQKQEGVNDLVPVDDTILDGKKFAVHGVKGSTSMSSFRISKDGKEYYLNVTPKSGFPTEKTDVEYSVKLIDTKGDSAFQDITNISFQVGYEMAEQSRVDSLEKGEAVFVDNAKPVYTADQLKTIVSNTGSSMVTFTNGNWTYKVRVSTSRSLNLASDSNDIEAIVSDERFASHDFIFLSFPATNRFNGEGELTLDVSNDFEGFNQKFYVYKYMDGMLSAVPATVNSDNKTVTFKTSDLARFAITSKQIDPSHLVVDGSNNNDSNVGGDTTEPPKNPDTGAGNVVGIAMTLAIATLATAGGALVIKKTK